MPSDIQKRIVFLRKKAKKSQQKMADELKMSRTSYAYNETKAKRLPDDFIEKVASVLEASTYYIRNGQNEKPPIEVNEPPKTKVSPVLTDSDKKMIEIYKSLPIKSRIIIRKMVENEFKKTQQINKE